MFLGGFAAIKLVRLVVRLVFLVLFAAVVYLVVTGVQVWLASRHSDPVHDQAAVVVGGSESNGVASPGLAARLRVAEGLWRRGLVPLVVVTGAPAKGHIHGTAGTGASWLESNGVPAPVVEAAGGSGLWGELGAAAKLLAARGDRQVLVVSGSYEEYRSLAIASDVGLKAEPVPATVPAGRGGTGFGGLALEALAVGVGRVIGYGHLHQLHDLVG